jgi:drug/metabolite transporter (DMT)-like permease
MKPVAEIANDSASPAAKHDAALTMLALAVTLIPWSSAFAGIRAALQAYAPAHIALSRFLLASALLATYAVLTGKRLPAWRDLPVILPAGFLGITFYHLGLNYGEQTVTAGAASLLVASTPVFAALFARAFLDDRLRIIGWMGIAVSFAGVALIALGESGQLKFSKGAVWVLLAALSAAASLIFQKRYLRKYRPNDFACHMIWSGTLFLLPFFPGLPNTVRSAPLETTLAIVYLGIFPTAIAQIAWAWLLSRHAVPNAAAYLYIIPVLAIFIAWIWLGEVPRVLSLVGGAITLVGVVMVNRRAR